MSGNGLYDYATREKIENAADYLPEYITESLNESRDEITNYAARLKAQLDSVIRDVEAGGMVSGMLTQHIEELSRMTVKHNTMIELVRTIRRENQMKERFGE